MPIEKREKNYMPHMIFCFLLLANVFFWSYSKPLKGSWANVPPVPSSETASLLTLGDEQLAYRSYFIMLQNLGNTGGEFRSLKEYDYTSLQKWLFLVDRLDPTSSALPMLASYYYAAVQDPDKIRLVIDYLRVVGARADGDKWRWLGQAVSLARHQVKDNDLALELAYELADNKNPDLADWAKQMPAFILQAKGEAGLAYKIMLNILISNVDNLHPNEINYMKDYICNKLIPDLPNETPPVFCNDGSIR